MKLNKIKKAVLAAAMVVIGTTCVFAQKQDRKDGPAFRGHHVPFNFGEKQVMGTVSSVNVDANIIVITDADGKSKKIHVNPLTKIARVEPKRIPAKAKKGDKKDKDNMPFPFSIEKIEINDLKAGHWITVQKFNTDTETIEALNISVHNWRQMLPPLDTSNAK
ncbi:hypothetical protein [Treponema sp.]|uniref:hypothetical protein n=1 Tax=Treponema sp. TaxID=166 RepID=UPI00298E1D08|nr:hypothetical protein [Treponema sp.]MCQ2241764.1 hypothetical protein [Treponema sp.]